MKVQRPYKMQQRAESAEATRRRIIDTATALIRARYRSDIRLQDVAEDANVSIQTIMRIFGSLPKLLEQALEQFRSDVSEQRGRAEPGDIAGAISALFDHYEQVGDMVIRNLSDEIDPAVHPILERGRARHREWVERQFSPQIALIGDAEKTRYVDALVCACDVYTWKLLRRDIKRQRAEAEATMGHMVEAILGGK